MLRPLIFTAVSVLALGAAPAMADPDFGPERRVVEYGDLDVYSEDGADALLGRIDQASSAVCGERTGPMDGRERNAVNNCTLETADNAVSDVGNSVVTARHYGYSPEVYVEEEGSADPYKGK
jgi:UrcA family protein